MKQKPFEIDLGEDFPHLSNAPIVEGVIEWTARAKEGLDPEAVKSELEERLPDYPQIQPQQHLQYLLEPGKTPEAPVPKLKNARWSGYQLFSDDKLCIAQFTADRFVYSRLKPYSDWETFSNEAHRLWRIFVEIFEPPVVQRLGLRFINRLNLESLNDLTSLLRDPPTGLTGIGLPIREFTLQASHEVPGHPYGVQVVQAIQPATSADGSSLGLIIDIDVSDESPFAPDEDLRPKRLPEMRWLKNKVFMSIVSDSAIESFK